MATQSKTTFTVLGIIALLLGLVVLLLPTVLNVDRYRSQVISYLEEKTGKQVEISNLSLTFFPLAIHVDGLGVKNPPIFPPGYIVKVAHIDAGLGTRAFLHRQVAIQSLVLDQPVINLVSDPDGPWNFEHPHANAAQQSFPLGIISRVQIKRGELAASNLLPSDAPGPVFFEANGINAELENVNLMGIINPSSQSLDGQGTLKAASLSLGAIDAKDLRAKFQLLARQVLFTDVQAEICGGSAKGVLFFDLRGKNPAFKTEARFNGVNIARVLAPFENGRGKMSGKMEGDLLLNGEIEHTLRPLAGIHGKGHVTVRDGDVPSLQLNANLMRLVRFNDLGPAKENPSAFNMISTDLELANLRIVSKGIDIDGYGVDIDGAGSVNVDGSDELDYQGVAQITTKQGFFTNTFARLAGASLKDGKISFPFRVGGTIPAPVFSKSKAPNH